jgi:ATP-dependent RNA helicase RhlE
MTSHSTVTLQPHHPAPTAPAAPAAITFASLALIEPLQRALLDKSYTIPSPIQAGAIPYLLQGRDLLGIAQTGTGKTAAFALPILQKLAAHPAPAISKRPRALILAPTRELAAQIGQSFAHYGRHLHLKHTVVFGGVGQHPQVQALTRGVDILVATPGRLKDLQQQKHVFLDKVEVFVLDEADRMLDMGFVHDVKRIITTLPPKRQSLLFSATMPPAVEEIASTLVRNPARVEVTPVATTAERIEQNVAFVDRGNKIKLLAQLIGQHPGGLVLAFVRMKHMANKLVDQLAKHDIRAEAIHGNKSQGARTRALENFRSGHSRVLIATDIAARGIDVKGISLVVNYDLPEEPESYVHRIGRTARAGKDGMAVAFCDDSERNLLRQVERLIRRPIPVLKDHPYEASERKPVNERVHLGDGIDRPHRPGGSRQGGSGSAPRREGGFRSRFRR